MVRWTRLLLVAIASLVLSLSLVEALLRARLSIEDLDASLLTYPELASRGWMRAFVRDAGRFRARGELGSDLGGFVHDPVLGWDVLGRIRRDEPSCPVLAENRRRVVVIGDSFTYGSEVECDQAFPAQLGALLPDTEVLNLGVRAYGVGQAALKYWLYGSRLEPDVVVFAIFGPDYYRTPLSFYRFAKPRFALAPDGRSPTFDHVPVPPADVVLREAEASLPPLSYGWALLRQAVLTSRAWQDLTHHDEVFYYAYDDVHEAILRRTAEIVAARKAQLLVVYVPQAYEFAWPPGPPSLERAHLERVFRRAAVPFIDLVDELSARHSPDTVRTTFYLWTEDRAGHFSPRGNRAVAEILADAIGASAGMCVRPATSGSPAS